jgi:hypothetical protein
MTQQTIFTGTVANDGTGDTPRQAGTKINANFTELYVSVEGLPDSAQVISLIQDSDIIMSGTNDIYTNKIYFKNIYDSNAVLPSATTYEGMFALTEDDNRAKFATDGNWYNLIDSALVTSGTYIMQMNGGTIQDAILQSPVLNGLIYDSSSNEVIKLSSVAGSPANNINISNSIAGQNPTISTEGDDTNIGITLDPKGSGAITNNGRLVYSAEELGDGDDGSTLDANKCLHIIDVSGSRSFTLADGTTTGEVKRIINKSGPGRTITLNIANLYADGVSTGDGLTITDNISIEFIWDGADWQWDRASDTYATILFL